MERHEAGHRLTWSNAGHLPPLLLPPDGRACLLEREPDLLLGVEPTTTRQDHTVLLPPGSTVLLYTDGLVERRGTSLVETSHGSWTSPDGSGASRSRTSVTACSGCWLRTPARTTSPSWPCGPEQ